MDGASADSDHSMTWEDFFGSTTDLTPTLIGIYDSLLEPGKNPKPETNRVETAKDARNDPPVKNIMIDESKTPTSKISKPNSLKDPTMIAGSVKLPIASVNKSSLYSIRTKSDKNGASETFKCEISDSVVTEQTVHRIVKDSKISETTTFSNLSPNVKRMISSASETSKVNFQKKSGNLGRSYMRHKSNIPLVGATSKITQSGVEILSSVEIYDQPVKNAAKKEILPVKSTSIKPEFKIDDTQSTYDVPTNNRPAIYDVPNTNKTTFESLSLPYIDQSIELSISSNDREFDIKLSSNETSPQKPEKRPTPEGSPAKFPKTVNDGTNSLHRKDFVSKNDSPSKLSNNRPYPEVIGSTGNLKSCTIPGKEIPNLNPPVVEVSRPLSMSSIASSSSTSSSGVQNKGGVNSAYLASIESLDDHSDADMTSANGSNNFVNNAGIITKTATEDRHNMENTPRQLDQPGLSQLERVCAEIVQTENVYVEDLRQVVEGYLHVWRQDVTFAENELCELFNNIEDIYNFNRSLCEELNTCRLDATCIARCFVNNTTGFSVYTSYCTGYPRTMERLAALASKPQSAREFRERQLALGHPLPLASYLLKPVQRILKYHLLLQNVVKQCASRETEYALLKMTGIAHHIDDMKRRHEHAVRVQEIQSLLYGWNGPDLTTYGELCAEGTFRVFGAKAMRHAFLFDKMLLVTKNREDGILAYKSHIMCNNMMLVESIAGAPLSFHVIPWDAPRAQLTLQARSPRHKREWTLLLKRVILENYNAVIPSHARQLVMELGQNKTDDDMLAEKSHGLITQASMRKQLSAPEYLEKRKLERERRKSFENGTRGRFKKANRKYTVPNSRTEGNQDCDCVQVSAEKGIDYTCENCYIDLCSDCETELTKEKDKCGCKHDENKDLGDKCPECDRSLHYIDAASAEHLERKQSICKCSDFKSSQESVTKDFNSLNKTRGYHSSDNIVGYTDKNKSKEDLTDTNNSLTSVRNIPKTCLKCAKIKENIVATDSTSTLHTRRSRCSDLEKQRPDILRSKSKDDPQRSRLSKIGTWRRKSEPGLQQNSIMSKKSQESDSDKAERGCEKIEFECRNCGSNKITKKGKTNDATLFSDPEADDKKGNGNKSNVEIRMYNTKNIPKKISKIKKNRAKGLRLGSDTTAKFYADFSTDVSVENILHISESNDSLNVDKKDNTEQNSSSLPAIISKDEDIDEETYKKLIEKTDSFKKNELEKVKYLNKQKVINEGTEADDKDCSVENKEQEEVAESCEETEQPLEQIISQLLMQNREFQKLLKKQQQRNSAHRRHQRLLKSHSDPEQVILAKNTESTKLKSKYDRQSSENFDLNKSEDATNINIPQETNTPSDEDHIYETLRIENRIDEVLHSVSNKSKAIQHNPHISRPKRLSSPPKLKIIESTNSHPPESDYVYLSFDQLSDRVDEDADRIYDVPVKSPERIKNAATEYYVAMENKGPANINENLYDTLLEVCRRKKDVPSNLPGEYLPISPDQQSPNTPEIWLSRQKEHFNVCRDRKSGSLPRSFQVLTSNQEESNMNSFKIKPNSNSKTYLNRDGKVMSTDRPFTIASDQSEISYDDVENYISDGDMLKFNKCKLNDPDFEQNISQSTLELEKEIDRCYKSNFEDISLDKNKNEKFLTVSQPNLNTSTASSCEVLPIEQSDGKHSDVEVIHPEHKIYKPTSNMLSLKNVLSRFKNKSPNKVNDDTEINANNQSSPDSAKSDNKSPSNEKRSALHPRSYSKNLLQRFRSIIGDEHPDDNQNKSACTIQSNENSQTSILKNNIQVIITTTETSPSVTNTPVVCAINNELLSKSVCEHSTLDDTQNEKNNLETLSHSCDNIVQKSEQIRPAYEKSVSLVTNVCSPIGSPYKSNNSSYQSVNKLPIYMQGSKHLGARIAQSDYVDPTTLANEKSALKNVNILINKNAVRPDSLFSNSSFVTTSSEGVYQESQNKTNINSNIDRKPEPESPMQSNADESYYEKSFEKIELMNDDDVFRDSAVYSDQEETVEDKIEASSMPKHQQTSTHRTITKEENVELNSSFKAQKVITSIVNKRNSLERVTVTTKRMQNIENTKVGSDSKTQIQKPVKTKIAPPVPIKPKISQIPTSTLQAKIVSDKPNTLKKIEHSSSNESINNKAVKRSTTFKQSCLRSESVSFEKTKDDTPNSQNMKVKLDAIEVKSKSMETTEENSDINVFKAQGNIQIKRMSFERASLDSATRKVKANENRTSTSEPPKIASKSVLERRMEIEQIAKGHTKQNQSMKIPVQVKPSSITTKVANFERSTSETGKKEVRNITPNSSTEKANIPTNRHSINDVKAESNTDNDPKSSWVKQVVNKFQ